VAGLTEIRARMAELEDAPPGAIIGNLQDPLHRIDTLEQDIARPSRADELLTQNLKKALALVDVRVPDHFVVAGTSTVSFAERGLI